MGYVIPQNMRSTINQRNGELTIEIPVKRNWFILLFLSFWLCGWVLGEIMVPVMFFSKETQGPPMLFAIAWLGMWTIGGGFAILIWLWQINGKEIIRFTHNSLIKRKALFSFGRNKEFGLDYVKNLRISPQSYNPFDFSSALQFWGMGGGIIAFDYGAKTYRFGQCLDESEAKTIINNVNSHVNIPNE